MTKKISISVTENQYKELKNNADANKVSVTAYIISNLPITQINKLTLKDVEDEINLVPLGNTFCIPDLFNKQTWLAFDKGSRTSVGRQLFKEVFNTSSSLNKKAKFIHKNTANYATYQRI